MARKNIMDLFLFDPECETEFLKKLEERLWTRRVEYAGDDRERLGRLHLMLVFRLRAIREKMKLEDEELKHNPQLRLFPEDELTPEK